MIDAKAFGAELAGIVKAAVAPVMVRLDALERRLDDLPTPQDGKDADPDAVAALVRDQIKGDLDALREAVNAIPPAPELPDIPAMVADTVAEAVKAIPTPQDGRDGAPGERGEPGRDGLDVKDLFRAEGGRLVAVMSDGTTKDLGCFVGADGKDGRDGADGKDGADGLGFDDMDFGTDDHGRVLAKFQRGDVDKSVRLPGIVDRGPYKSGESYEKGDAVSYGGSLWIAQEVTGDKPDGGKGWRLAVKKGRDARGS